MGSLPFPLSVIQRFQLDAKPPSSVLTLYGVAPRVVSNVPNSRNIAWVRTSLLLLVLTLSWFTGGEKIRNTYNRKWGYHSLGIIY